MPVISAYSSSGSSYISPSSYRYKSSLTDRKSYTTSTSSSLYRRSSYRYDLPSSSSVYSSSYRTTSLAADRTADADLSSTLASVNVSSNGDSGISTTVNGSDSSRTSRPSRYSTVYSYSSSLSSAPIRDYSSRLSSRSSDTRFKDRDNNCLCAGGAGSSSYVSNLRNTALSGAELYQKYSVSTYKPNSFERIVPSRSPSETPKPSSILKNTSPTSVDISKLRPALNGTSNGGVATGSKVLATASATTDDLHDGDYHVTATIRIKPKSSISHASTSSSSSSSTNGSTTSINNNNNANDGNSSGDDQEIVNGDSGKYGSRSNLNNNNNNNNNVNALNESERKEEHKERRVNGVAEHDSDRSPAIASANSVDKEPKTNDDDKVSYLRAGTASKSIHSTSPVGYRSRDYDSGIGSYRSGLGSSSLSSSSALKSSYDRTNDDSNDSSRNGSGRKEGLCGLWNIGNTCFMNSIIQCLSHTRELTNFLRQQSTTERGTSKDHKILAEYTKLIKDMWSGTCRSVNPSELKYAFSSKHRMYSGSAQQDAQEFLRFFIDSLHCGLNESVKREPINRAIEDDDMDNRVKATMMWDWYSRVENSMIKNLFVGLLRSTLKCTYCNGASVTFDPFWDLSLPLPSTNSRCKLESCMDVFVKEEVMDGIDQPTCSRCKTRRKCTKSLTIERFPKYLVIHLKRFSETRWSNKLTNVIEFPTGVRELSLQSYASEDHSGPVNYSLYGISNHMGSTAGGHYVAVCKHPVTKEWNEFNDNFVSETSERSLVTSSAYVLFYERT